MRSGLVFDTTALTHFARADRLDVLATITEGYDRFTPTEVMAEAQRGVTEHPAIGNLFAIRWITIVELDIHETVQAASFKHELGGSHLQHLGECAVLATAQSRGFTAVIDDQGARSTGGRHRIGVAGSLTLIARGVQDELLDRDVAADVVDALLEPTCTYRSTGPGS